MFITWAPWRTLISTPLLSIEMIAASSTSASLDNNSLSGFEKMAFSSYHNLEWKLKLYCKSVSRHNHFKGLRRNSPLDFAHLHQQLSYLAEEPHTHWRWSRRQCQNLQWNIYHWEQIQIAIIFQLVNYGMAKIEQEHKNLMFCILK